jgi:hypothetical protein
MSDFSRLTRLITLALASCAITWALAGTALARPELTLGTSAPAPSSAPAYQAVPGDVNKAPVSSAPAFKPTAGDTAKTPDPTQVQRVLNGLGRGKVGPVHATVPSNDDTGTVALFVAIAAILMALAAVSMTVVRPMRRTAGI